MKLVELLAKELTEWPEKCSEIWQSTMDLEIYFEGCNHEYTEISEEASDRGYSGAHVTRAQWQAERDRQKGGEWKRHRGGKQPVADGTEIAYKLRDGTIGDWAPERLEWDHTNHGGDIMQYRIIIQPQSEEVEVNADKKWYEPVEALDTREYKGPFPCSPAGEPITELDWNIQFPYGVIGAEAFSKTDQIDGPLKWRDTIIHCQAIIEDCEREIAKNENLLALEGFALIPATTPVIGVADIAIPLSDWKVGDIVEVISVDTFCDPECKVGDQMPIVATDDRDGTVKVVAGAWGDEDNYRFIRRP